MPIISSIIKFLKKTLLRKKEKAIKTEIISSTIIVNIKKNKITFERKTSV